jgi:hypothetical protein
VVEQVDLACAPPQKQKQVAIRVIREDDRRDVVNALSTKEKLEKERNLAFVAAGGVLYGVSYRAVGLELSSPIMLASSDFGILCKGSWNLQGK